MSYARRNDLRFVCRRRMTAPPPGAAPAPASAAQDEQQLSDQEIRERRAAAAAIYGERCGRFFSPPRTLPFRDHDHE